MSNPTLPTGQDDVLLARFLILEVQETSVMSSWPAIRDLAPGLRARDGSKRPAGHLLAPGPSGQAWHWTKCGPNFLKQHDTNDFSDLFCKNG